MFLNLYKVLFKKGEQATIARYIMIPLEWKVQDLEEYLKQSLDDINIIRIEFVKLAICLDYFD